MIKNKILSFAGCLLLSLTAIAATERQVYTLEQCQKMALLHNVRIKNARNNVMGAVQTREEAFTGYFPSVSASGMGYNANKGLLGISLMENMQLSMLKNGIVGGVTAVQPVFAGGKIINSNKLAKVGVEVSSLQMEQSEKEVRLTTEMHYRQIITLQEKIRTLASVNNMLESLCKEVEASVKAGVVNRNDLLQVKLKKNEVAITAINLENNLSLCRMVLDQYVGMNDADFEVCSALSTDSMPPSPEELHRNHEASLALTTEHHLLEKNVEASRLQQKLEIGKNLPTIGIGAAYLYHDVLDQSRSAGAIFASVSIPISAWWGGSHAVKRQKLQTVNAQNELKDKSELILIRMQQVWNELQDSYKQLAIARNSIEQAEENLRINNDYYRIGTSRMSELLEAQSLYQQSRDKYVETYSAYYIKRLEYVQVTGQQ